MFSCISWCFPLNFGGCKKGFRNWFELFQPMEHIKVVASKAFWLSFCHRSQTDVTTVVIPMRTGLVLGWALEQEDLCGVMVVCLTPDQRVAFSKSCQGQSCSCWKKLCNRKQEFGCIGTKTQQMSFSKQLSHTETCKAQKTLKNPPSKNKMFPLKKSERLYLLEFKSICPICAHHSWVK